jgi:DNA adenine methylase
MKTPISYWGGKQMMSNTILSMIPKHRIYNEPFFGGGAIFFAKQPSEIEFINDINGIMITFYRELKLDFPALKQEVDCTLHSEFQHKQAKAIYLNPQEIEQVKQAWAVFVLSKQSMYSILGNAWKLSLEGNEAKSFDNAKKAFTQVYQKRLERTSIFCRDAIDTIKNTDTEDTFHYCDPPYFNSDCGHYSGYTEENYITLLELLSTIKGKFLLSSYPNEPLARYVKEKGWYYKECDMPKSAGSQGKRKIEALAWNYDLNEEKQMDLF